MTKHDESGAKALGFQRTLERFETLLALTVALTVFEIVDDCNVSLQSKSLTLSSAKSLATNCVKSLQKLRCDSHFHTMFQSAVTLANTLEIGSPQLPKVRRVSRRLDDNGSASTLFDTPEQYYRKQCYELIDTAVSAVNRRFDQPGMELACTMESVIIRAAQGCIITADDDEFQTIVAFYHEFETKDCFDNWHHYRYFV